MTVLGSSTRVLYFHSFVNGITTPFCTLPTILAAMQKLTAIICVLIRATSSWDMYFWSTTLARPSRCQPSWKRVFRYLQARNTSRVTISLRGGVLISAPVRQAQLPQTWFPQAIQEHYIGNRQQLHLVPHIFRKVKRDVLHQGYRQWEIGQCVLQWFGRSKQPSQ